MKKLLIAVPCLDYITTEFVKCLTKLLLRLKDEGVIFDVEYMSGTLVYVGRDKIASKAINEKYSHVLWFDSDMIFTDDVLENLMDSGKSFVAGIYNARRVPYSSCLFKSIDLKHLERFDEYPDDTFEIAGCGFGCVLMETEILEQVMRKYGTCFLPMKQIGEDIAFCQRVKDMGFKMYAEPTALLGHVGQKTIYPEDHDKYMKELAK